jgi:epoxide hydrolase-like predicted phosphatase
MIRAVIFDYFDVIRPAGTGVRPTYRRLGGDVTKDEAFLSDLTTAANWGFVSDMDQQIADRLGISVEDWRTALAGSPVNDLALLEYVVDLRARGYKTALLSNAPSQGLETYFTPQERQRYFDVALVSGATGMAKPEAAFYRLAASQLAVQPEECIMIDDRHEYCQGARHVGMQAIEYRHYDQLKAELEPLLSNT